MAPTWAVPDLFMSAKLTQDKESCRVVALSFLWYFHKFVVFDDFSVGKQFLDSPVRPISFFRHCEIDEFSQLHFSIFERLCSFWSQSGAPTSALPGFFRMFVVFWTKFIVSLLIIPAIAGILLKSQEFNFFFRTIFVILKISDILFGSEYKRPLSFSKFYAWTNKRNWYHYQNLKDCLLSCFDSCSKNYPD